MSEYLRVAVTTLGCKANQYDSSAIEEALGSGGGLIAVPFPGPADAYVINTCTVTSRTDCQSRQLIRRARRSSPGAVVIVTGCYAQVSPSEVRRIPGVDYVLGNSEKGNILSYIRKGRRTEGAETVVGPGQTGTPLELRAGGSSGRTRANLKVQDGCNRACSYCIIPRARGASRSLPLESVEAEIERLVEKGYREIVLTGIHLGAYGADLGERTDLASILKLIEKRAWPCRVRLSSIDPDEVSGELIDMLRGSEKICNHVHLPLQSGDEGITRRMRRSSTPGEFSEKVERLVREVPGISVGTDVIAGFPGEGGREFENTYRLLEGLPVSYLHVFPFSAREGTPAAGYTDRVDPWTLRQRCLRLKELDESKRKEFYTAFVGSTAGVLVETTRDRVTGMLKGKARNYIPVVIEDGGDEAFNEIVDVRLTGLSGTKGMRGKAILRGTF